MTPNACHDPSRRILHGQLSLGLLALSLAVGLVAVWRDSPLLGLFYSCVLLVALPVVLWAFCAKCPGRDTGCGHVLPGRVAALMPRREPGAYSLPDLLITLSALAAILLTPQPWLWSSPAWLAAFWLPALAALVEIRRCVCPGCANENCPGRK